MAATETPSKTRPTVTAMIQIDKLIPTPDNPRRVSEKDPAVISLAQSIKANGILHPLLARPHPRKEGFYDLRAGCRRWTAAKVAGLFDVPVIVREMDDQTAVEITVTENLQRENLSPIEEARGIELLLKHKGWDHLSIAGHLGKSIRWVARRAQLTKLSAKWQKWAAGPGPDDVNATTAGLWPVSHLELIARLPEALQERLLGEYQYQIPSLEELERETVGDLFELKGAPWGLDDATLEPKAGSCKSCAKRTAANAYLFSEEGEDLPVVKDDRCLDPACWGRKLAAHVELTVSMAKLDHGAVPVVAQSDYDLPKELKKLITPGHVGYLEVQNLKSKPSPGATPVIPVTGPHAGRLMFQGKAGGNSPSSQSGGRSSPGRPGPTPLKVRRENLEKRRAALVIKGVREEIESAIEDPQFVKTLAGWIGKGEISVEALVIAFMGSMVNDDLIDRSGEIDWGIYDKLRKRSSELLPRMLAMVADVWIRELTCAAHNPVEAMEYAERVADVAQLDWKALVQDAAAAIPVPRSWAELNADGTPKKKAAAGKSGKSEKSKSPAAKPAKKRKRAK